MQHRARRAPPCTRAPFLPLLHVGNGKDMTVLYPDHEDRVTTEVVTIEETGHRLEIDVWNEHYDNIVLGSFDTRYVHVTLKDPEGTPIDAKSSRRRTTRCRFDSLREAATGWVFRPLSTDSHVAHLIEKMASKYEGGEDAGDFADFLTDQLGGADFDATDEPMEPRDLATEAPGDGGEDNA